ncbi:hypothetical protein LguiA_018629 [Lonicera macranthoides]
MDDESGELRDWELLHNSDDSAIVNSLDSVQNIIRSDYFSLQNHPNNYPSVDCKFSGKNELGIVENDETQLVHDGIGEIEAKNENSGGFRSDCSETEPISSKIGDFDPSGDGKFSRFGVENELDIVENDETLLGQSGIDEIVANSENSGELRSDSNGIEPISSKIGNFDPFGNCKFTGFGGENELGTVENDKTELGQSGIGEIVAESENSGEFLSNCSGIGPILSKEDLGERNEMEKSENELEVSVEEQIQQSNENESVAIEAIKQGGEKEKRRMVWWKLPLELLRYCAIRVSPVWTVSVAAAVLGFIILGRRLHKMKRKSHSLQLKVTVDDKKVSQFMSKAARLNEAFSIVKRVPIIRPSLPASGVTPWPVMNLR